MREGHSHKERSSESLSLREVMSLSGSGYCMLLENRGTCKIELVTSSTLTVSAMPRN